MRDKYGGGCHTSHKFWDTKAVAVISLPLVQIGLPKAKCCQKIQTEWQTMQTLSDQEQSDLGLYYLLSCRGASG